MKVWLFSFVALLGLAPGAQAQDKTTQDIPAAAPSSGARPGETDEQHGKRLLDEMLVALGGQAWLNRGTVYEEGRTAAFFRGQPNNSVVTFLEWRRLTSVATGPEVDRTEFLAGRGQFLPGLALPGQHKSVAHIWTVNQGYELTYKGLTVLPALQVGDYLRRRAHTLDEVMRVLIYQPGVTIIAEGTGMRDRVPIDKVTILTANSDAVSLELAQDTHLPVQRGFEWRNPQFKDHDLDEEVYGDWRMIQGIATPMNMTSYKNGDIVSQTFYTKVVYGETFDPQLFNPDTPFLKK